MSERDWSKIDPWDDPHGLRFTPEQISKMPSLDGRDASGSMSFSFAERGIAGLSPTPRLILRIDLSFECCSRGMQALGKLEHQQGEIREVIRESLSDYLNEVLVEYAHPADTEEK